MQPDSPTFPGDAFAGTADYYVRYRIPYPERLLRDLLRRSGAARAGRLLDLACGPGRVALPLAGSFEQVVAVDLEPEMIEAGRREAARLGIVNIAWAVGRAEELAYPPGGFGLITIGEAFHRLDQGLVASKALQWLQPGGCLALLGSYSIFRQSESWQRIVVDVVRKWSKRLPRPALPAGLADPSGGPKLNEQVLRGAGFVEVASHPFDEPQEWTVDSILGFLYSTSVCSKAVLGADSAPFECELRAGLLALDPAGTYREDMGWGYTLARKPL